MRFDASPGEEVRPGPAAIVGIAVEAGQLEGVEAMLDFMPHDAGLSFVVVPRGEVDSSLSSSAERLRKARRPLHSAAPAQALEVDHVYLAPLGARVWVENSSLRIAEDLQGPDAFDGFLSSLASDQHERAIGAVLSAEHRHGQLGLRAIERAGGLALGHLSWRSDTGSLRLEQNPHGRLSEIIPARVNQHLVLSEHSRQSGVPPGPSPSAKALGRNPRVEALSRNLRARARPFLIDTKAPSALGGPLDALFDGVRKGLIRGWVPECGPGQGAYALAMLMLERCAMRPREHHIQVFGSDSDEQALAVARAGSYPLTAVMGLSPERRQRFFVEDEQGVQVSRELRNSLSFAVHDVFRSPPLTRIDLLSAGHMLADCPTELRSSLLETFHYALRRGGLLLIEPGQRSLVSHELFELIDADCGLFRAHRFIQLDNDKVHRSRDAPQRRSLPASRGELTELAEELRGVNAQRLQDLEILDRTHADLKNFVQATEILAFICDRDLCITRASKALDDWLGDGLEPGTLLEDVSASLPGGKQLVALAASVQHTGESQECMHQVGTPPRAYLIRLHPYRDQRGGIDGVVGVFTDVSALEDARAIASTRERQQAAVAELGLAALGVPSSELAGAPYELYGRALDMLSELLGCERGFVLERGHDMRALLVRARRPEPFRQRASSPVVFLRDGGPLQQALAARGAMRLPRALPGDALLTLVGGSNPFGGVACPLRVGDSVYGLLAVCTDAGKQLAAEDLHFVQALANVLAGAIGRQRARRRLTLEREVGLIVAEVDSVPRLGQRLQTALADTVGIDGVELWVAAQDTETAPLQRIWPEPAANGPVPGPEPSRELERTFRRSRSSWRIRFHDSRVETEITFPVLLGKRSIGAVRCQGSEPLPVDDELLAGFDRTGHAIGDFLHWMRVDEARRESERRLRRQSAELESIYATLPVGLATYDRELNPLRINERFRELEASAQRENMLTESVLRQVVDSGVAVRELELTTHSEVGPRSWLCSFAPVKDSEGDVAAVSSVVQDITERKRNEQSLRDADRQKDEFLVMLSHELRNPLAAIRNATELLGLGEHSPDVARLHGVLDRQTEHMAKLIGGLLDVSRIVRGKLALERTSTDLVRLMRGVCQDCATELEQEQLTLEFDAPDSPVWVDGDPARLVQIFDNLLANAVKFTPDTGTIRLAIEVREESAVASIEDNGIGIEPDLLPHIFEPFRQAEQSAGRSLGGMGLGLSLVRGLVELHGGAVSAGSRGPGRGSTFRVELPLAQMPGRPATMRPPRVMSLRIVIIEDNADMAETLADLLGLCGHDVVGVACSGEEGLACVTRLRPQVVLCDLGLPGQLDGLGVVRSIRENPELEKTQVVAVTGYGDQVYRKRAAEAGFDACLIKPVNLEDLQKQLERSGQKLA